jgi:uncharacterized protein (DUF362 family)
MLFSRLKLFLTISKILKIIKFDIPFFILELFNKITVSFITLKMDYQITLPKFKI